ncbi:MAG: site-2 protease family protein [Saprospiraceae bacterium]|jgi:Zn-dependent protease/predicted transcriptional regulator|nr:site-2 protease family protein [Saprospiraceae bacterium]
MRGSLKLFTWFGIPVYLHWSFGLIFLYALWISYANNLDTLNTVWLMGYFAALFGCVLLHEYGHALTARRYGVRTQDIILTPIGGIARLERMPEKPVQEFLVAIAGPLVNVVLAALLFFLGKLLFEGDRWTLFNWVLEQNMMFGGETEDMDVLEETGITPSGLLYYLPVLLLTNIALVVFNLIPAFPMDGGRIFRALLAMRLGRVRATQLASWMGQAIAVLFVVFGLWKNAFSLALIGIFVFTTARAENNMVRLDALLRRFKARDLMRPNFTRLAVNDWMQTPIGLLNQGLERHFLVFDLQDQLVGILEEARIVEAMKKRDLSAEIGQYIRPDVGVVGQEESMEYIFHLLQQRGIGLLAVADRGELVGVIDQAGLQNFLRLNSR